MTILEHVRSAVAGATRPIIAEIGAARCEDTSSILNEVVSASADGAYEYYAFEPDPRNIRSIKDHAVNFGIHLIPAAVGNANQRTKFYQSSGINPSFGYEHTLSGSLKAPVDHLNAHPWCKFDSQIEVRMMTLDSFMDTWSVPHFDFIWCDVQGAEDLVIAGAQRALARTRFFYTEYYDSTMYEGQIPAQEIHRRLPGQWQIVQQWPNDILFANLCFQK